MTHRSAVPSRLLRRMPAVDSTQPLLSLLVEGGTVVLRDDSPHELITGSAGQLHRVDQAPPQCATRERKKNSEGCHAAAGEEPCLP